VVLAGMVTKFEIWDQGRFEERLKATDDNLDADMAELAAAGFELRL
jgi:MraZ protein